MEYFSYELANEEEKQTKENKNKQKTNKKRWRGVGATKTEQDIDHNQNHNKHDDVRPDDHGGCVLYHLSDDTFLQLKPSFEIAEIEKDRQTEWSMGRLDASLRWHSSNDTMASTYATCAEGKTD